MKIFINNPWVPVDYQAALETQSALTRDGLVGWYLFSTKPVITLGKRATEDELLLSPTALQERGISVLKVDRGGLATYHGPEQILGFPIGTLAGHTGNTRGVQAFVDKLVDKLARFFTETQKDSRKIDLEKSHECPGLWLKDGSKVASIGLKFEREQIKHGFAFNVSPLVLTGLLKTCGEPAETLRSLYPSKVDSEKMLTIAKTLEKILLGLDLREACEQRHH